MKTKLLIISIISVILLGCPRVDKIQWKYEEHYVKGYYNTNGVELINAGYWIDENTSQKNKVIYINAVNSLNIDANNYFVGEEEYLVLCEKHGDIGYNRDVQTLDERLYTNLDFTDISIVSDADFDEAHPANTDLGDIIKFHTYTPIKHIQSGYIWYNEMSSFRDAIYYIFKMVNELEAKDMILLGSGNAPHIATLEFKNPTLSKVHNITVTMVSDDGRTFEDTVEITWE